MIGVDPGLADLGWGIVASERGRHSHLAHGVVRTKATDPPAQRLLQLFEALQALIGQFHPTAAGIETLFFNKNITSALPVAQARGVALLAFAQAGLTVGEYSPPQIKSSLVGVGTADKHQVQEMVKILLNLKDLPKPDHAADALAAAICHLHRAPFGALIPGLTAP